MEYYKNADVENIAGEVWAPVPKWEKLYEISSFGRVKSILSKKILKQFLRKGYLHVNLCYQHNRISASVHRLVCESFRDNPNKYPVVNHIDCNALNNYYLNVEWCTISHNTKHAWDNGRIVMNRTRASNGTFI